MTKVMATRDTEDALCGSDGNERSCMMIDTSSSVGQIASAVPASMRVFEKWGIDYCCRGNISLVEACNTAGVEVATVVEAIEGGLNTPGTGTARDWSNESLNALIDFILETHHVYTRDELDRFRVLAADVARAHGKTHPEVLKVQELLHGLDRELTPHMMKEEQILFPFLRSLETAVLAGEEPPTPFFGTVRGPIEMMLSEHETAGQMLAELREVTSGFTTPDDACFKYRTLYEAIREFELDIHQHIHLENNILFPRAVELEAGRMAMAR